MRKLASQKYDVLDYLLNKDVEYVCEVVNSLGPHVKQAQVLTTPEQQELEEDEVAVVLFHPHIGELKKYACNTPELTEINMNILSDKMDEIPDEIVKTAANNLTFTANKYNLDIPEKLAEYTSDKWVSNTIDLSRVSERNFLEKISTGKTNTLIKQASNLTSSFALKSQGKYPLNDRVHTELAVEYFEKNASKFTPEERVEYAVNTNKALKEHEIKPNALLSKYASLDTSSFNPEFEIHMDTRSNFVNDEELANVYTELKNSYSELGLKKTAVLVHELDKRSGIEASYAKTGLQDAVLTTFGMVKVASVDIDGVDVNENDLAALDRDSLKDFMDDSTISELEGEEGLYILKSLPKPVRSATLDLLQ